MKALLFGATEVIGLAMLNTVRRGANKTVLEARDINALADQHSDS